MDCIVERCKRGIALIRAANTDGSRLAPIECSAIGNTIDSGTTDATTRFDGINVTGAISGGTVLEWADGIRVIGNVVRNYGLDESSRQNGGMVVAAARGMVAIGNTFVQCSSQGVALNGSIDGLVLSGNIFVDNHATVAGSTACVRVVGNDIDATIAGNRFQRGDLTGPPHIGEIGVHVNSAITSASGVTVREEGNDWTACDTPTNDGQRILTNGPAIHYPAVVSPPRTDQLGTLAFVPGGQSGPLDSLAFGGTDINGARKWHELIGHPGERVGLGLSLDTSIPDATWTTVSWSQIVYQAGFESALTAPIGVLTMPFAGHWAFAIEAVFDANATGLRGVKLRIDGTDIAQDVRAATSGHHSTAAVARTWPVSSSIPVEVQVYQNSGGPLDLLRTLSMASIYRIGLTT